MSLHVLWWSFGATLGAVILRIWHLLLMKEALDSPLHLLGWIIGAWAAIAAMYACERVAALRDTVGVPRLWSRRPTTTWVLLLAFSCLLLLFNAGFQRAVGDGRGYFAQVRSIVIDHDLDFGNDIEMFAARPQDADFPLGTALLWTPFFALGHLWLGWLNLLGADLPREGFGNPYQRAVGLGTFAYGFAAMAMIAAMLRRRFDGATTAIAAITVLLGTPVVWYVAVDASMSHGASLFTVTLFLALWMNGRERRDARQWVWLTTAAAIMTLMRPQNAVFLTLVAFEAVLCTRRMLRAGGGPARLLPALSPYLAPFAAASLALMAGLAAGAPELAATSSAAAQEEVPYLLRQQLFTGWHVLEQLFSPQHGLISNSPVVLFAMLGLVVLWTRDRLVSLAFGTVLALQLMLSASTPGWNAGASFGARRFVECAPLFAFGLAAAIDLGRRRPLLPVSLLLGGLVAMNLFLVDDASKGSLTLSEPVPFERMTRSISARLGNPFALPGSMFFAWRHEVPLAFLDSMPARSFGNFTLDVGGGADEQFLVGGWLHAEREGDRTTRWTSGPEAVVFTRLRHGAYRLNFVAEPFAWPGGPQQTVEVWLGKARVGTLALPAGFSRQQLDLPAELTPAGEYLRLAFRFGHTRSPLELGLSDDGRKLAVRFDSIELLPR